MTQTASDEWKGWNLNSGPLNPLLVLYASTMDPHNCRICFEWLPTVPYSYYHELARFLWSYNF